MPTLYLGKNPGLPFHDPYPYWNCSLNINALICNFFFFKDKHTPSYKKLLLLPFNRSPKDLIYIKSTFSPLILKAEAWREGKPCVVSLLYPSLYLCSYIHSFLFQEAMGYIIYLQSPKLKNIANKVLIWRKLLKWTFSWVFSSEPIPHEPYWSESFLKLLSLIQSFSPFHFGYSLFLHFTMSFLRI